jgi:3-mercaptopyruvate sulfurtransferase SseA
MGSERKGGMDVSIEDVEKVNPLQRPKMDLISTQELKEKLDRGDDFKLVMALGEWEYNAKHIPGSLRVSTVEEALEALDPKD